MHQGVFFIAIILTGCLAGKLLHRQIKFMNNNYFIMVYHAIKNILYIGCMCVYIFLIFFPLLIFSLHIVSTELATILLFEWNDRWQGEN